MSDIQIWTKEITKYSGKINIQEKPATVEFTNAHLNQFDSKILYNTIEPA